MNDYELQRFLKLVQKGDGCWMWIGSTAYGGYGLFALKRNGKWKNHRAHREAYKHFVGPIGDKHVCHKCDIPGCVNPDHLFLGSPMENALDRKAKGRTYKGGATVPWTRLKTHCKNGHELAGENLSKYTRRRVCLACLRERSRAMRSGDFRDAA